MMPFFLFAQHDHPVGNGQNAFKLMGDNDKCDFKGCCQFQDQAVQFSGR